MKQLLMSIQPQHLYNILKGKKTLEIRKQIPKGFKGWVNLYCTTGKPYLLYEDDFIGGNYISHRWTFLNGYSKERAYEIWGSAYENEDTYIGIINGLVVARFWFDEHEEISLAKHWNSTDDYDEYLETYKISNGELCDMSCLTNEELEDYLVNARGYAMHIKKLHIFDKPKALSDFYKYNAFLKTQDFYDLTLEQLKTKKKELLMITKAPQNYMYVEVEE